MAENILTEGQEIKTRNMGSFTVGTRFLEKVMQLPDGIRIVGIEWDFAANSPRFYLEGNGLPAVQPSEVTPAIIPNCRFEIQRDGADKILWDWG